MNAPTFSVNAGLGIPTINDDAFPATLAATLTQLDGFNAIGAGAVKLQQNPSTSLNVVVAAGTGIRGDNTEQAGAGGTVACTGSATNYLYWDTAGAIHKNTTGFPASTEVVKLAIVVAGVGTVTSITDARLALAFSNLALSSTYALLAGATFTGLLTLSGVGAGAGLQFTPTAAPGSPADGQIWYDSSADCLLGIIAGSTQRFAGVQFLATASATVANTVAETTLVGTGVGSSSIAANQLKSGKTVRVRSSGFISTTGSPTATVQAKLGGLVLSTGSISPGTGLANAGFQVEADFTCRSTGAGGVSVGQGRCVINGVIFPMVNTSAVTVVDTTVTEAVAITMTWGTAAAGNTVTVTNMNEDILN